MSPTLTVETLSVAVVVATAASVLTRPPTAVIVGVTASAAGVPRSGRTDNIPAPSATEEESATTLATDIRLEEERWWDAACMVRAGKRRTGLLLSGHT
jgi:hypothetical protein